MEAGFGVPGGAPPPRQSRGVAEGLAQRLGRWIAEVGPVASWGERLRRDRLQRENAYRDFLRDTYGDNVVAAAFTLSCGGGVRFEGQEDWIRPEGDWQPQVLHLRHVPVVALDLRGSPLTYNDLDNLVRLTRLRHLDLSDCPHLDDWALGRLHFFGGSLRELSVARCPRVTERGLATLHHLRLLRRLDVAGLRVPSPGLMRILLEETLPGCQILGIDLGDNEGTGTMPPPAGGEPPL
ncbi:distal membrane-arm assembly complex protein 2 [Athene noctua]|uniref:distal membrane-arm assembly complex protein 2 n=1 Tax=Athene noctua TaxID=126797 RepID=UPI003EBB6493